MIKDKVDIKTFKSIKGNKRHTMDTIKESTRLSSRPKFRKYTKTELTQMPTLFAKFQILVMIKPISLICLLSQHKIKPMNKRKMNTMYNISIHRYISFNERRNNEST